MKQLTLELTDSDVFSLLQALGKRPYEEVADLIEKIRAQCEADEEPQEEKTDFSS
jgi:succinate dehydrogenase flavin-adding protein (antitoxin of CptAB toxin-antitoxin module)